MHTILKLLFLCTGIIQIWLSLYYIIIDMNMLLSIVLFISGISHSYMTGIDKNVAACIPGILGAFIPVIIIVATWKYNSFDGVSIDNIFIVYESVILSVWIEELFMHLGVCINNRNQHRTIAPVYQTNTDSDSDDMLMTSMS